MSFLVLCCGAQKKIVCPIKNSTDFNGISKTAETIFKISSFVLHRRKKIKQFSDNMEGLA